MNCWIHLQGKINTGEITGSKVMMLKTVFEYAITLNTAEANFYVKEEGPNNKYALEHKKKAQGYQELLAELDF